MLYRDNDSLIILDWVVFIQLHVYLEPMTVIFLEIGPLKG